MALHYMLPLRLRFVLELAHCEVVVGGVDGELVVGFTTHGLKLPELEVGTKARTEAALTRLVCGHMLTV